MNPELRQFIEQARFYMVSVQRVAEMLPADDAELDALIDETARGCNLKNFMYVTVAAAYKERPLDARHLRQGAMLIPDQGWLGKIVVRMHGDVAEHLMAAIENTRLNKLCEATALHLVAVWCQEHRDGKLPERLMPLARARARDLTANSRDQNELLIVGVLRALAARINDEGLTTILRQKYSAISDKDWAELTVKARDLSDSLLKGYRESVEDLVPKKPKSTLADGSTMRRAVPRIGRNEPCTCGSGKKYKHCCIEKDHERLYHSSGVAGVTDEELSEHLEEHLTAEILEHTEPFDVVRLDPRKIPVELLNQYLLRLAAFNFLDRAMDVMEILGWSEKVKEGWESVMFGCVRAGRRDIGQRLLRLREPHGFTEAEMEISERLLLAGDDQARCLQLIEEKARTVLKTEDMQELLGLAYAVTFSKTPALGILVYRGVLQLATPEQATRSFEQLLLARDRLNLPPDDPFSDILDKRLAEREVDDSKDAAQLREAQRSLETKAREVHGLKEKLSVLQKEISHREQKYSIAIAPIAAAPASPVDEQALKELRGRVEELKLALKERHHERNELRRELQKAHDDLETLRQTTTATSPEEDASSTRHEEELLLPQDAPEVHPVRLTEFPKHFHATLEKLPRHVARATVIMAGRLAAGEPAAFVGALRLKATPKVMRQRIGSDYRLLFRLWPERLEVIDLINRKDLDRRLKALV